MSGGFNTRSPTVKRIIQEAKEVQQVLRDVGEGSAQFAAEALESDIFEWRFAIRGPDGTPFESGIYHGRILLPHDYPFKPPSFIMLTPSGRFETNTKICLSISSYHPEQWQPSWSMRTALTALIAFFPTPGQGAVGSLQTPDEQRRKLALESRARPPKESDPERAEVMQRLHDILLKTPVGAAAAPAPPPEVTTAAPPDAASAAAAPDHDGSTAQQDDMDSADRAERSDANAQSEDVGGSTQRPAADGNSDAVASAHAGAAVQQATSQARAVRSTPAGAAEPASAPVLSTPTTDSVAPPSAPPDQHSAAPSAAPAVAANASQHSGSTAMGRHTEASAVPHVAAAVHEAGTTLADNHDASASVQWSAWNWRRYMQTRDSLQRWRVVCHVLAGLEKLLLVVIFVQVLYPIL